MQNTMIVVFCFVMVAACADFNEKKDYTASAKCHDLGFTAGTPAYDDCVKEEQASNRLKEQRREFDRMKQSERDWKMRRY